MGADVIIAATFAGLVILAFAYAMKKVIGIKQSKHRLNSNHTAQHAHDHS